MKQVSLFASIATVIFFITQIYWFIINLSWFDCDYRYEPDGYPIYFYVSNILSIIAWGLIAYFFITLYRKQPK